MFLGSVLKVISAEHNVLREQGVSTMLSTLSKYYTPFNIKAEYLDAIIFFSLHSLLPGVELLSLVDVFPTCITPPIINK